MHRGPSQLGGPFFIPEFAQQPGSRPTMKRDLPSGAASLERNAPGGEENSSSHPHGTNPDTDGALD
jgi:hypothetical protein